MAKILIIYFTTDGHTREICHRLQKVIEFQNNQVALVPLDNIAEVSLKSFDKIILGASIRYGKHNPKVYAFIKKNSEILESKPNAFFSVNLVSRKPEKNQPETNPYLQRFLKKLPWQPSLLAVFAGKLDYQKYSFIDRMMIRMIMWMTKGPSDPKTNVVFTNWDEVDNFGRRVSDME